MTSSGRTLQPQSQGRTPRETEPKRTRRTPRDLMKIMGSWHRLSQTEARAYQPPVPAPPLNGPTTRDVTQLP